MGRGCEAHGRVAIDVVGLERVVLGDQETLGVEEAEAGVAVGKEQVRVVVWHPCARGRDVACLRLEAGQQTA